LLRPEAIAALRGSDLIIHAGDIGLQDVLQRLQDPAPTHAVRGNIYIQPWARKLPEIQNSICSNYLIVKALAS
jgi:predicted phosphodiesterase